MVKSSSERVPVRRPRHWWHSLRLDFDPGHRCRLLSSQSFQDSLTLPKLTWDLKRRPLKEDSSPDSMLVWQIVTTEYAFDHLGVLILI